MARSPAGELLPVSIAAMDAISERDRDARKATASGIVVEGASPFAGASGDPESNNFNDFAYSLGEGAVAHPLPFSIVETGVAADGVTKTREVVKATVTTGLNDAVPSEVYEKIIASKFDEADRIMNRELTGAVTSSGASKQASFNEGKSPRLAMLAGNLENAMNATITFMELRNGAAQPRGFVDVPRDYEITDVVDSRERTLALMLDSGVRSGTLAVELIMDHVVDEGIAPEKQDVIRAELEASARASAAAPAPPPPDLADAADDLDALDPPLPPPVGA